MGDRAADPVAAARAAVEELVNRETRARDSQDVELLLGGRGDR